MSQRRSRNVSPSPRRGWARRSALLAACGIVATSLAATAAVTADGATRAGATPAGQRVGSGVERATIVRDHYGVPSISAPHMAGVWFGAGYAQAEDRLVQLELVRRTVEGTLSRFAGSSYLSQDEDIRTFFYTPAELQQQYDALPASVRSALKAFSDGINAYTASIYSTPAAEAAQVPYEYYVLGTLTGAKGPYRPAPWSPLDTVAVGNYLAREFGGGGGAELSNLAYVRYLTADLRRSHDANAAHDAAAIFDDTRWLNDPTAPTTVPGTPVASIHLAATVATAQASIGATTRAVRAAAAIPTPALLAAEAALRRDRAMILHTGISLKVPSHDGSDAFAVVASRSKDHHALLWGAPQEGFGTPSVDGEEYLHGPGYDAGGMDITGEPFILIGRNAQLAWTTTSEELVDQRVYSEKVRWSTTDPTYWFHGAWTKMGVIRETIPVLGEKPATYVVYRTADGPIFSVDWKAHTAFAMRFASWGARPGPSPASPSSAGITRSRSSATR